MGASAVHRGVWRLAGLLLAIAGGICEPVAAEAMIRATAIGPTSPACRAADPPVEGLTCEGPDGWQIAVGYPAVGATLAFRKSRQPVSMVGPQVPPLEVVGGPGPRAEWTGVNERGQFRPRSVVVPAGVLHADDRRRLVEDGEPVARPRRASVLLVFLLDDRQACLVAIIDRSANTNAAALARRAAAEAFTCPVKARIPGRRSAALSSLVGQSR